MIGTPSPPWFLRCPWCDWMLMVNARGMSGADPGSGVEAAMRGEDHALHAHNKTWRDFLAASPDRFS